MAPEIFFTCLLLTSFSVTMCIFKEHEKSYENHLNKCVANLIKNHLADVKGLTIVDISAKYSDFYKIINSMGIHLTISRTALWIQDKIYNEAYVIESSSANDFLNNISYIVHDVYWNPRAKFIVSIEELNRRNIMDIFSKLLEIHVHNVALVGDISGYVKVFTYNPFKTGDCGRKFNTIQEYNCTDIDKIDLFRNNIANGFSGCTLNVIMSDWPPYVINSINSEADTTLGIEQYVLKTLSELEGLHINYTDLLAKEKIDGVLNNLTAVGHLRELQNNDADIAMGGLILIRNRAEAFDYLYSYMEGFESYGVMLKAVPLGKYKGVYQEFGTTLWFLILFTLIVFTIVFVFTAQCYSTKRLDKTYLVLVVFDYLLQHGSSTRIHTHFNIKYFVLLWIWYTFFINCFYQTSLVSLISTRKWEVRIKRPRDLRNNNMIYCLSAPMIDVYLHQTELYNYDYPNKTAHYVRYIKPQCSNVDNGMDMASKNNSIFTIISKSYYKYNNVYFGSQGEPLLTYVDYTWQPIAMMFYKGFPLLDRFHIHALNMREAGLTQKNLNDIYYLRTLKNKFVRKWLVKGDVEVRSFQLKDVRIAFYLLFGGILLSLITYIFELYGLRLKRRMLFI